jgi:hypothetical protein
VSGKVHPKSETQGKDQGARSLLANRIPISIKVRKSFPKSFPPVSGKKVDSTAPFLREHIPSEENCPELHRNLTQLWYERQDAIRGLVDALAIDDSTKYSVLLTYKPDNACDVQIHAGWGERPSRGLVFIFKLLRKF